MTPANGREESSLIGCRVYAYDPRIQGEVIEEQNPRSPVVRVRWDAGELTWARRDHLYLVKWECA